MARQTFDSQLRKLDSAWKKSQETQSQMFTDVEDGTYEADLTKAKVEKTSSGNMRISRQHVVVGGDFDGCNVNDSMNLENEVGMAFTRRWLDKCGYDAPVKLVDLPPILDQMVEDALQCKITISHTKDFVNVRVDEVLEGTAGGGGEDDYTADEIEGMERDQLIDIIEDEKLEINPDERKYKRDNEKLQDAIVAELDLVTEDDLPFEEPDDDDETKSEGDYSYDDIQEMAKRDLRVIIKKEGLKVRASDHSRVQGLRDAICKELGLSDKGGDETGSDDEDELFDQALDFCSAHDVTIPDEIQKEEGIKTLDDVDDIALLKNIIGAWSYTEEELLEDEFALLETLELADRVEKKKEDKPKRSSRTSRKSGRSLRRGRK